MPATRLMALMGVLAAIGVALVVWSVEHLNGAGGVVALMAGTVITLSAVAAILWAKLAPDEADAPTSAFVRVRPRSRVEFDF